MENERKKRRKFSAEFKSEAVRMSEERTLSEVSRNLGISLSALTRWRSESRDDEKIQSEALPEDLVERCKKLEAENRRLKLEQEILKKATAFFAREFK